METDSDSDDDYDHGPCVRQEVGDSSDNGEDLGTCVHEGALEEKGSNNSNNDLILLNDN